jgi:phage gp16-like protein
MEDMDSINPHSTTFYYNLLEFLKEWQRFKNVKINGVIDKKMLELADKMEEYSKWLQLEKMILNYQIHTLTYVVPNKLETFCVPI